MKTILVLTDFSENSKGAAEVAAVLADKMKAEIILFNAFIKMPLAATVDTVPWPKSYYDRIKAESNKKLETEFARLQKTFSEHHYQPEQITIKSLNAEGALEENVERIIKEKSVALIVMGARNKKTGNFLFGSNINEVLNKVNCPVLIVPKSCKALKLKTVIFATDLGAEDIGALNWVVGFTEGFKSHIHVSHVQQPDLWIPDFEKEDRIDQFVHQVTKLNAANVSYKTLEGNFIVNELLRFSKEVHADLITLMHRKHSLFWRLLHENPCSDLINYQRNLLLIMPEHLKQ